MIGNFEDIEHIAGQWLNFSREVNGWSSQNYEVPGLKIWCYFADDGNYRAVNFNGGHLGEIGIGFHNPPQFYNLTKHTLENLHDIVIAAESGLEVLRAENAIITEEYKQEVRQKEIENLRGRLAELEGA